MWKLYAIIISAFIMPACWSQTVIYSENFDGAATWTLNVPYGAQGADPNFWTINDNEGGVAPPGCGVASNGDESLHITSVFNPTGGAAYDAGGLCGFFTCPLTHTRAESPNISTVGNTNLTLKFDYIHNGQPGSDFGSIWINPGTGWVTLVSPLATTVVCGSGQGQWTAYSVALPASCENIANLKIGFGWENNDDGVGTDPSIAINNVQITTPAVVPVPPVSDFTASLTTLCAGDCITFTNTGTFEAGATFSWNFGNSQTSILQTPPSICYATAGTYTVSLTITDANGSDTETKTNYIVVNDPVSAGADNIASVCDNTSINLNTILSGADAGGTWLETTGTPSGQFTPATGIFNANGLTPGNYTFSYTVNGTSPCPNDIAVFTVTVNPCSGPTAGITASSTTVCVGQPVIFNDNSIGMNIDTWIWSFGGGTPGTANTAGPHNIVFNTAGTFNVWHQVSDDNGTDDITIQVTVVPCSNPTAAFSVSDGTICPGACVTYMNQSTSASSATYQWTFDGGSPSSSASANPGSVCYYTPGTYTTTLVVTNAFGTSTYSQNVTVLPIPTIVASGDTSLAAVGDVAIIEATASAGDIIWTWTPSNQGSIVDCPTCDSTTVTPLITTVFTATVTTGQGCTVSDYVTVTVDFETAIGVPNSFSPDENGINDILSVKGIGIDEMVFRVYNRYGQMVFESLRQIDGWDGRFKGEMENPGTFVYTLEYILIDGTTGKMNGNVTLVR